MMQRFELRKCAIVLMLAALSSPVVSEDKQPASPVKNVSRSAAAETIAKSGTSRPAEEKKKEAGVSEWIVYQTNVERHRYGMPSLRINEQLSLAAKQHAEYMARTGQFSHYAGGSSPQVRAVSQGYRSYSVSENIAYNYTYGGGSSQQTASKLTNQWLTSSGHRANMLSGGVNEIGVGTARTADGRIYGVQLFGRGPARIRTLSSQSTK